MSGVTPRWLQANKGSGATLAAKDTRVHMSAKERVKEMRRSQIFASAPELPRPGTSTLLPGLHSLARDVTSRQRSRQARPSTREVLMHDPIRSMHRVRTAPQSPPVTESLNPYRAMQRRNDDEDSMERRHQNQLTSNRQAFRRQKGDLGSYLNQATAQSDMLVWQTSQHRSGAELSPLNAVLRSNRPLTDTYEISDWSMARTERTATSPMIAHRHKLTTMKRTREQIRDPTSDPTSEFFRFNDRRTTGQGGFGGAAGSTVSSMASLNEGGVVGAQSQGDVAMHNELLSFERAHHQKMRFEDFTKMELIELIKHDGLEVPGKMMWDASAGEMKQEICKKQVYVDYCKRKFYDAEPQPLARAGKLLGGDVKIYVVVSFFKAAHGAVRVLAYNDQDCREYQKVLVPNRFKDLDLTLPPKSVDKDEWLAWSKVCLARLELTSGGCVFFVFCCCCGIARHPMLFLLLAFCHCLTRPVTADASRVVVQRTVCSLQTASLKWAAPR